jgi:hypothetical protein
MASWLLAALMLPQTSHILNEQGMVESCRNACMLPHRFKALSMYIVQKYLQAIMTCCIAT